ncbi:MAG: acyl-CoA dehydrogenase [Armatimonadetes bacterium]|nr:acyl-CoA dehydrogenase [Armatimonadota bacterium]NOG39834.1 acyl-CoA dehydrogenase [Armatimonadota bacterium]GIK67602.1 MAG: acyl-CoA dehydrogenase [Chloroflexota bacterium]
MDFTYPPHVQDLVHRVRAFIETEVIPLEAHAHEHRDGLHPNTLRELRNRAKSAGVYLPQLAPEYGGLGLNLQEIVPVFETAGRSLLGPLALNCAAPDEGNMHLLHLFANEEQRERYLHPLAAGDIRSAFSMTEPAPGTGSDPAMIKTTATRDGDDFIINGHKWFSTGADGAAFFIVMAVTDPDADWRLGSTMFLAPAGTPGIEMVRRVPVMGAEAPGGHGEMKFHDVRLPASSILGNEGAAMMQAQARLGPARLTHCMRWLGIAQRALEIATKYATEREAFGSKLSYHQAIQWMIADSETEIHASRLMIQQAAWLIHEKGDPGRSETSMTKTFVAETVNRVLDRAIQICGAKGISRDLPLSQWYEEARAFRIYDGASEVHRMVVARQAIKKYTR